MEISKSNDGLRFFISGRGFPYGDFNKAGKIDLWRTSKCFESGRAASLAQGLSRAVGFTSSAGLFVRFQVLEFSPLFYSGVSISTPWNMTVWLCHIGRTSFCLESVLCCQATGVELTRNICQVVRVDRVTRRPICLPVDGVSNFRKFTTATEPPKFEFPEAIPTAAYSHSIQSQPSHTDSNQHVNQSISFQYCMDCASVAAMKGVLPRFTQDMAYYNVKKFAVEYTSEMKAGDTVNVDCWSDSDNQCILYFVLKIGSRIVGRCKGEMYANANGDPVHSAQKSPVRVQSSLKPKL